MTFHCSVVCFLAMMLCAAQLALAHGDHHHHHHTHDDHHHDHHGDDDATAMRPFQDALIDASFASVLTSILPICVIPLVATVGTAPVTLQVLAAFAAGAMLADTHHHVLPALSGTDSAAAGGTFAMSGATWLVAGFLAFFLLDGSMPTWVGAGASHGHAHPHHVRHNKNIKGDKKKRNDAANVAPRASADRRPVATRSSAMLSLLADFSHNFTDGLVLGVSAPASRSMTYRRAAVLMAHELPHEVGDYAILSQCGWSLRSVLLSQVATALGNWLGCMVAVTARYGLAEALSVDIDAVECFVGGSFVYLSTVVLVGDLSRATYNNIAEKLLVVVGFVVGTQMVILVSLVESL